MKDDLTRSRRKIHVVRPCELERCDGETGPTGRCAKCHSIFQRLRGMRPGELDEYERTSLLRLDRLAIIREERKKAGLA